VLFHSLYGTSLLLNPEAEGLLERFAKPATVGEVLDKKSSKLLQVIDLFSAKHFLLLPHVDERKSFLSSVRPHAIPSGGHLRGLMLLASEQCNLACSYCVKDKIMGLRAERPQTSMSLETATRAADAFLEIAARNALHDISLTFRGGEPLLVPNVVCGAVRHTRSRWKRGTAHASLVTNGTLVSDGLSRELAELKIAVEISIDGPRVVHDRLRLTKRGRPTHDSVLQGLHRLREAGVEVTCVNATVTAESLPTIDEGFLAALGTLGLGHLNLEPDVLQPANTDAAAMAKHILNLRASGRAHGLEVSGCWARPFGNLRRIVLGHPLSQGNAAWLVVDALGMVVGCEYNAQREFGPVTQVADLLGSRPYQRFAESRLPGRIKECLGCEVEGPCQGNASLTLLYERATGRKGLFAHRCDFIRAMTRGLLAELATRPAKWLPSDGPGV
jgi:uncharacterized protein